MAFSRGSESFTGPTSWTEVRGLNQVFRFVPKDMLWDLQAAILIRDSGYGRCLSITERFHLLSTSFCSYLLPSILTGAHSSLKHCLPSKSSARSRRGRHLENLSMDVFS